MMASSTVKATTTHQSGKARRKLLPSSPFGLFPFRSAFSLLPLPVSLLSLPALGKEMM
jgi:hypothetical protein